MAKALGADPATDSLLPVDMMEFGPAPPAALDPSGVPPALPYPGHGAARLSAPPAVKGLGCGTLSVRAVLACLLLGFFFATN